MIGKKLVACARRDPAAELDADAEHVGRALARHVGPREQEGAVARGPRSPGRPRPWDRSARATRRSRPRGAARARREARARAPARMARSTSRRFSAKGASNVQIDARRREIRDAAERREAHPGGAHRARARPWCARRPRSRSRARVERVLDGPDGDAADRDAAIDRGEGSRRATRKSHTPRMRRNREEEREHAREQGRARHDPPQVTLARTRPSIASSMSAIFDAT